MKNILVTALFLSSALIVSNAFANTGPTLIKADGSSTVYLIAEAFAEEFQISEKGKTNMTVGISGTGGGFKKFCNGDAKVRTDIQNASRPIQEKEMAECKKNNISYFELPVAFDAIVVVVNSKNDWVSEITVEELKKIWEPAAQGKIKKWNQVNAAWPDKEIKLYGAGTDSGTFDYFSEAIVGKSKSSRGDYTASEDDNTLVTGVANDRYALGYLPIGYFLENKSRLKALSLIGGAKAPVKTAVAPTKETVEKGTYFPLSRPVFIYVNADSYKKAEVKRFVDFIVKDGFALVSSTKFIALPESAYKTVGERIAKGKVGTVFGGHSEIGLKIDELLKKEAKQ